MPNQDVQRKRERKRLERLATARARRAAEDRREKRSSAHEHVIAASLLYDTGKYAEALREVEIGLRQLPDDRSAHALHYDVLVRLRASAERLLPPLRELYRLGDRFGGMLTPLFHLEARAGDLATARAVHADLVRGGLAAKERGRLARVLEEASAERTRVVPRVGRVRAERIATATPSSTASLAAPASATAPAASATPAAGAPVDALVPAPPSVPAAVSTPDVELTVEAVLEPGDLIAARAADGGRDPFALFLLALEGHDLAAKERFDDLLCLAHLTGVDRYWYQVETARRCLRVFRGRVLLCDEVGLGKTIEAAMVLKEYLLRGLVRTALVLVPASLVGQWRAELKDKFAIDNGGTDDAEFTRDPDGYLDRHAVVIASLALARREGQRERFASRRFDFVAVDEAHRVKDHRTESYQLVDRLKSRFLLLLTATPVENDLMELFNLVTLLRRGQLKTRQAFRDEFLDRGDPTSPRNREKLRALLREVMVRNTRALSDAHLPPRVAVTTVVEPEPAEAALYAGVVALVRARGARLAGMLLAEAGSSPAAFAATAERMGGEDPEVARLAAMARSLGPSRKDHQLLALLARAEGKTVVFTRFVRSLEHLAVWFAAQGMAVAVFRSGMSARDKDQALAAFRERLPVLLSTDVGAEGLNLQFATNLVNYDLPWNPMRIEQRIGRLHRIGQTHEVRVWNLCTRGTAEDRLLDVLDRRLNLFEMVVGEMDMVLGYLADDRDFETIVAEVYRTTGSDEELGAGFERIAAALEAARGRYERVKRFDQALLGEDYEL